MSIPGVMQPPPPQAKKKALEELNATELSLVSVRALVSTAQSLAVLIQFTEAIGKANARQIELLEEIAELLDIDDDEEEGDEEDEESAGREAAPPVYARNQKADLLAFNERPRFTERVVDEPAVKTKFPPREIDRELERLAVRELEEEDDDNAEFHAQCVPNPDWRPPQPPEVVELVEDPYAEEAGT